MSKMATKPNPSLEDVAPQGVVVVTVTYRKEVGLLLGRFVDAGCATRERARATVQNSRWRPRVELPMAHPWACYTLLRRAVATRRVGAIGSCKVGAL